MVPFLDLSRTYLQYAEDFLQSMREILSSQKFILGKFTDQLEKEISALTGRRHGIGVSSGTDALLISLMALDLNPGDEVITTPFTFFATAGSIVRAGGKPVFVDIDPETYNIDPDKVADALGPKTRAVVTVDLYGQCADYDRLEALTSQVKIPLIEDACQALGASWGQRKAGNFGLAGCFSFFPTKNLGGAGDGGMIVTNDEDMAERFRSLRTHGETERYHHAEIGINGRLDEIQAAYLLAKLPLLNDWSDRRREAAAVYDNLLADIPGILSPVISSRAQHIYHQFTVKTKDRDRMVRVFAESGIGYGIYYPIPLHLQPCFAFLGYKPGDLPVAEETARQVLSLPIFPGISSQEQEEVIDTLRQAVY